MPDRWQKESSLPRSWDELVSADAGESLRPTGESLRPTVSGPANAPSRGRGWPPVLHMAAAFVLGSTAGALIFMALPGPASLRVELADAAGASDVKVYVDGVHACNGAPCTIEVDPGEHHVAVTAAGHAPSPVVTQTVSEGGQAIVAARLGPAEATEPPAKRQPAPALKSSGPRGYLAAEINVEVATPGARVFLQRTGERHERRPLFGPWPQKLELEPDTYELIAFMPGYRSDVIPLNIGDKPSQTVVVELAPWR